MGSAFRKGSEQSGQSAGLSMEQAQTARASRELGVEFAGQTKPLRLAGIEALTNFFQSGQTPGFIDLPQTVQPLAALSLPGLESEQGRLREQLLAGGARGGLLQQQLAQTALQGGLQRTGLLQQDVLRQEERDLARANLRSQLFGGGLEYGTGGLSLGLQGLGQGAAGLGSAAGNLNTLGAQRIQQNMAFQQGLGQLVGGLAKSCWIAIRLYGLDSCEVNILRYWLFTARRHWWFTGLYLRYGEWLSRRCWVGLWRPWFDRLIQHARGDVWGL